MPNYLQIKAKSTLGTLSYSFYFVAIFLWQMNCHENFATNFYNVTQAIISQVSKQT